MPLFPCRSKNDFALLSDTLVKQYVFLAFGEEILHSIKHTAQAINVIFNQD